MNVWFSRFSFFQLLIFKSNRVVLPRSVSQFGIFWLLSDDFSVLCFEFLSVPLVYFVPLCFDVVLLRHQPLLPQSVLFQPTCHAHLHLFLVIPVTAEATSLVSPSHFSPSASPHSPAEYYWLLCHSRFSLCPFFSLWGRSMRLLFCCLFNCLFLIIMKFSFSLWISFCQSASLGPTSYNCESLA